MIRTQGRTHLSLAVRDPDVSLAFYEALFGVEEYYRDDTNIQAKGNGTHDIFAFELDPENAGRDGGVRHFGFRLVDAADIDDAIETVLAAGGTLRDRGEFAPGYPYAYVFDKNPLDVFSGTANIREAFEKGTELNAIREWAVTPLNDFKKLREPFLLYR